jgi:hypothetical protein
MKLSFFPVEIPKIHTIKKKYQRSESTTVTLQELQKNAEKVNVLLIMEYYNDDFVQALLNIFESISPNRDVKDQVKLQSNSLTFSIKDAGMFFFGKIRRSNVALWLEDDLPLDKVKEVLQSFSAAEFIVNTGFAVAFKKTCKRGDIIVSGRIDGVRTIIKEDKTEKVVKCSFCPDDTRFTPVPSTLSSIFDRDWGGILCTEQRQRKSMVEKGTVMATTSNVLETLFSDEDILDQLQKQDTHDGFVLGGATLLKAVKECGKKIIFVHGVGFIASELIHGHIRQDWSPTVAESLANYIKFKLEKMHSGRHCQHTL